MILLASRGEVLERADADVAARDACEHGAGEWAFPSDYLASRDGGQSSRCGNSQGVHRFAHQILSQHRSNGRFAVAAARERSRAGAFERDVAPPSPTIHHFAQQQSSSIAQLRNKTTELMACVGLSQRITAVKQNVPPEDLRPLGRRA